MQAEIDDEHICLEGYGPAGVAVILTCRRGAGTPERTEARRRFAAHGGRLGAAGSVAYLFRPVGVIRVRGERSVASRALSWGAEEVVARDGGEIEILSDPCERASIAARLLREGLAPLDVGSAWRSMQRASILPLERPRLEALTAALRGLDGVCGVYTNA